MGHIVYKVGEDYLGILKIVKPIGLPFKRDKLVVIYRGKSAHYSVDRHSALTDKLVCAVVVRVADVHVSHVCAEAFDGLVSGLAIVSVRVVNVPQSRKIITCKAVKHCAESCCVSVNTAGLYKNTYVLFVCNRQKLGKSGAYRILVVVQRAHYNVRYLCVICHVY